MPPVQAHAPALRAALLRAQAARAGDSGGRGGAGAGAPPGVLGVQAYTSDGRTSRTPVRNPALASQGGTNWDNVANPVEQGHLH